MRRLRGIALIVPAWLGLLAGDAGRGRRQVRRHPLHQGRVPHPDAGRRPALHDRLYAEGRRRSDTRSCSSGRPTGPGLTAPASSRPRSALRHCSPRRATSSCYQDVRGCFMSEGQFVDVRPQLPTKHGPERDRREHRHLRHDRLAREERPEQQRPGRACGASPTPASTPRARLIDAHPALKAVSPQAPVVDWFVGDDSHHNGAFFLQQAFNFDAELRPAPARADARRPTRGSTTARRDAYDFFLEDGPAAEGRRPATSRANVPFWNDVMEHGTYDDFWKARNLLPHLKDVQPGRDDRRRLVRRRGPLRHARDLRARSRQPVPASRTSWSWARGSTAAGLRRRRVARARSRSASKTVGYLSRADRVAVLRAPPEGQRPAGTRPRRSSSRRARTAGTSYDAWPPRGAQAEAALPPTPAAAGVRGRRPDEADAFDEYVSDPARPGPVHARRSRSACPRTYMVDDQRFAAQRPDVLVYQTGRPGRGRDRRRADRGRAARLDDRDRRRLGREADRRLSRRLPRPEPNPTGVRWAATSSSSAAR